MRFRRRKDENDEPDEVVWGWWDEAVISQTNEANPPCSVAFYIHEDSGTFWAEAEGKMERWTGAADTFEEMVKVCWEAVRVFIGETCSVVIHFPSAARMENVE